MMISAFLEVAPDTEPDYFLAWIVQVSQQGTSFKSAWPNLQAHYFCTQAHEVQAIPSMAFAVALVRPQRASLVFKCPGKIEICQVCLVGTAAVSAKMFTTSSIVMHHDLPLICAVARKHPTTCMLAVDYSKEAVRQQQEAHKHIPQLVYMEGDVRRLTANALLQPSSFVGVLDKGTMDALLRKQHKRVGGWVYHRKSMSLRKHVVFCDEQRLRPRKHTIVLRVRIQVDKSAPLDPPLAFPQQPSLASSSFSAALKRNLYSRKTSKKHMQAGEAEGKKVVAACYAEGSRVPIAAKRKSTQPVNTSSVLLRKGQDPTTNRA
eukprot:1149468-Pelagomonas_calceolata.AAC.4